MKKVWIVDLESVPTRYTCQWKDGIPELIKNEFEKLDKKAKIVKLRHQSTFDMPYDFLSVGQFAEIDHIEEYTKQDVLICVLDGQLTSDKTTPGAFLNFAATNIYKASQAISISTAFSKGLVEDGDFILFTDAWNPVITQVKYMKDLFGIDVKMGGIWHAGSYDEQDFLGRLIQDKRWSYNFERSAFYSLDYNFFATDFHIDLFVKKIIEPNTAYSDLMSRHLRSKSIVQSGQPHNKLVEAISNYNNLPKRDLILFPHRLAPEKQLDIFKDLAASMPEYEWIVCQEQNLSKDEYHTLLGQSKMVFSANLQETLGISAMEAILVNSIPCVPNRLSYVEMYDDKFKYPSEWSESFDSYLKYKPKFIEHIKQLMTSNLNNEIEKQKQVLLSSYLSAAPMMEKIING